MPVVKWLGAQRRPASERTGMSMDIVIVREGDGYRLLHGHLRLANVLRTAGEAKVHVKGEGELRITRVRSEYLVDREGLQRPLHRQ
jgi:hypothetical protein